MVNNQTIKEKEWITVAEAAHIAGDSESHILDLLRARKVKTRHRKQTVFVHRNSLPALQYPPTRVEAELYPSQIALAAIEQLSPTERQQRNAEAIRLLTEWSNATGEEAADQADTLAYLVERFDEKHGNRDIFSDELKQQY